ncbi:MAG: C-type lectin domain-containing protein [Clostridiales bacterium]|nr:C-type lectin domain-containing protein [Clostridiales bacterium]
MTMALQSFEAPEIEEAEPEALVSEEDTSLHSYQIVIADCTWAEAMQQAQEMGGYLVRINSQEEYDAVIALLEAGDYAKYHFYLGGRRDSDGTDYYWVDTDNFFVGECLNDSASWAQSA